MSALVGLQERLAALQETTGQLPDLVDRLANLASPPQQPGETKSLGGDVRHDEIDEYSCVADELSAEIGLIIRTNNDERELLLEEARDLRPEGHEKERLVEGIERLRSELLTHHVAFRKARLQARKNISAAEKLKRQLILRSYSSPVPEADAPFPPPPPSSADEKPDPAGPHNQNHSRYSHQPRSIHQKRPGLSDEDQQTVGASSSVTSALRRTHDLMAAELSRSEFARETLEESSAALRNLDDAYGSLGSALARSRDLLGTLLRSQKSDTWYLQTAFYVLVATAAWLVFRRVLYGPLWWLVFLPLRVLFGIGSTATTRVILPAGRSVLEARKHPPPLARQQARQQGPPSAGEGGGVGSDEVSVEGIPDASLPTVRVDGSADEDVEEAVREAVDEAVRSVAEEDQTGSGSGTEMPAVGEEEEEEEESPRGEGERGPQDGEGQGVSEDGETEAAEHEKDEL